MRNASRKARASGEKRIAGRDIRKVTMVSAVTSHRLQFTDVLADQFAQIQRMNIKLAVHVGQP